MNQTNHIAQGCSQGTRIRKTACSSTPDTAGSVHSIYAMILFYSPHGENDLSLATYPRLALNVWPSCPSLPSVAITGMCHSSGQGWLLPLLLLMMPWGSENWKLWSLSLVPFFFLTYFLQCFCVSGCLILPRLVRDLFEFENLVLDGIWKKLLEEIDDFFNSLDALDFDKNVCVWGGCLPSFLFLFLSQHTLAYFLLLLFSFCVQKGLTLAFQFARQPDILQHHLVLHSSHQSIEVCSTVFWGKQGAPFHFSSCRWLEFSARMLQKNLYPSS